MVFVYNVLKIFSWVTFVITAKRVRYLHHNEIRGSGGRGRAKLHALSVSTLRGGVQSLTRAVLFTPGEKSFAHWIGEWVEMELTGRSGEENNLFSLSVKEPFVSVIQPVATKLLATVSELLPLWRSKSKKNWSYKDRISNDYIKTEYQNSISIYLLLFI
jgi:hypothetical protein